MSLIGGFLARAGAETFGAILKPITDTVQAYFNKEISEEEMNAKVTQALTEQMGPLFDAQARVLIAEQQHGSWLTRNWRPMVVLTSFAAYMYVIVILPHLVMWKVFGVDASGRALNPSFGETGLENLFWIVAAGMTAYIGGRSFEKVAKTVSEKWSRS